MATIETETVVIGGGQAGVPLARGLADAGRAVALVEAEHLGGSCVNFGCTPSKAVIASARLAADARRAAEYGLRIPEVAVDFGAVMDRARGIVAEQKASLDDSFKGSDNPRIVGAHARLAGRDGARFRVEAGRDLILADRVVLDTGTRSARPPVAGLDEVPLITAEDWIALRTLPPRLLILGGSYIALEMAQAFRRLGSEVTVLQAAGQLAEREDPDVAAALQEALETEGIHVALNVHAERAEPVAGGLRLHTTGGSFDGSHLLAATGRTPNTDGLGLDTVGVALKQGGIVAVDDHLQTSVPGIFAAGDIRGGPAFTHTAYDDHWVLLSQLCGDGTRPRASIIPYAMFTDPELGRVGMSETDAKKAGRRVRVGCRPMTDSGKARELGKTAGFIKVLLDADTDAFLGATCLCAEGGEIVQLFVELMNSGATARTMQDAVHIHPTLAEAAKNALVAAVTA